MVINNEFLEIPYNPHIKKKKLEFYIDGKLVYDMECSVDFYTPNSKAYMNVSKWMGKDLIIKCYRDNRTIVDDCFDKNEVEEPISQCGKIPKESKEDRKNRPFLHFTSEKGWVSDPIGLFYQNGKYHTFFQYNPVCPEHSNLHWGHISSDDLFNWEVYPNALEPDENGMKFDGCAVVDKDKLIVLYTAAGGITELSKGKSFNVSAAISKNNIDFKSHSQNPIIANTTTFGRDPKVVWCQEFGIYLMLLYQKESTYALFSSQNLTEWMMEQSFEIPGDSECPDIYKLFANGDRNKPMWVVSGASDMYFVGKFETFWQDNRNRIRFVASQPVKKLHYGSLSYAGQSFYGLKEGDVKRITWLSTTFPELSYSGQHSIPMQMTLSEDNGEYYLQANPVENIKAFYEETVVIKKKVFENGDNLLGDNQTYFMPHKAIDMIIEMDLEENGIAEILMLGFKLTLNFSKNTLTVGNNTAPLSIFKNKISLRLIIDKNSLELFIDQGKSFLSSPIACDYSLDTINIRNTVSLNNLSVTINSVDKKKKQDNEKNYDIICKENTMLGIDIGSTTISFSLADTKTGDVIKSITLPNDSLIPGKDYESLYDTERIMEIVYKGIDQIPKELIKGITCIGVTGQMHGVIYLDENGMAISPLYTWMDKSGDLPLRELDGLSSAEYIRNNCKTPAATGWGLVTVFNHTKLGVVPENARKICSVPDYVTMRLSGTKEPIMHVSNAASFGLFDVAKSEFRYDLIEKLGINMELIPAVTDDYLVLGKYENASVCVSIGDNQAGFISSVNDFDNTILANIGTGSQISFAVTEPLQREGMELRPLIKGKYILVGSSLCGGRAFSILERFFRETACLVTGEKISSAYPGIDDYLDSLLEYHDNDAFSHSLCISTLFGGTRADSSLRGSITNIDVDNFTPEELIKGFMFGMCRELHDMYKKAGITGYKQLVGSGNAVRKSKFLQKVLENVFDADVNMPKYNEEAAYGAAMFASVCIGLNSTIEEAQVKYLS